MAQNVFFGHFWVFRGVLSNTTEQQSPIEVEIWSYAGFNGLKMGKNQCFYIFPLCQKAHFLAFFDMFMALCTISRDRCHELELIVL
mgnify:CR=1 FL=1